MSLDTVKVVPDGTDLINLAGSLNSSVQFIKTDAVLGSTAILLQPGSGHIQYAMQPDLLGGQVSILCISLSG
jgi:hypothetical protein